MKLDYTVRDPVERLEIVEQALIDSPNHTASQMNYLADYLLFALDARSTTQEKSREYPIVTRNRDATYVKRQVSYEELVGDLQHGEDAIYNMIRQDKDMILDPKEAITEEDKATIPGMRENFEIIESLKRQVVDATGRRKYSLKAQIISKYKECYSLKSSYVGMIARPKASPQVRAFAHAQLPEHIYLDENGMPASDAFISLLNPRHVSFLLRYYQVLKQESYFDFDADMRYLLYDLEDVTDRALRDHPILYDVVIWKIDGMAGDELVRAVEDKYGVSHSAQYFSTLWSTKIPKLISEQAKKEWLVWHYTYEDPASAHWKICRTCGKVKLAHPFFFNKNASTDGFYSKCRECRSLKKTIKKEDSCAKTASPSTTLGEMMPHE